MTLKQRPAGRDRTLPNDRVRRARELGIDPYPARCHAKTPVSTILEPGALEECWAAGRIRGIRTQDGGRSIVLSDLTGSLRIRVRPEGISGAGRKVLGFIRPGDIIEARGRLSEGEFLADEVRLLAAGAEPEGAGAAGIPAAGTLRLRASLLKAVRGFFDSRGFLEVETPALLAAPDPAPHLDSFVTEYADARGRRRFFLQTSPELPMKRLLGAGHERIYQIAKFFRNGERTALHNPEFTGIEWYEAYADYRSAMETAETLVASVTKEVLGETRLRVWGGGGALDLSPPWERIRVRDAFIRHAGIDLRACMSRADLAESARKSGVHVTPDDSWEDLFFKISLERVEPMLGRSRPTLLFDYPAPLSLLAKRKIDDPAVAERFEIFAGGMELANGFTELNDPAEQRDRWERELDVRRSGDPDAPSPSPLPPLDEEFLEALEGGVPPAAGVALGLDRWVMLLAGCADIGEVRCFAFDAQG